MSDLELPPAEQWEAVLSRRKPESWVVYQLKKKGKSRKRQLVLVQTGSGGMADALSVLTDDAIQFFGFRVTGIDEKGGAKSLRSKFVKVCYIGDKVSTIEKAKTSGISGKAFDFFKSCHVQFTTDNLSEVTEESVEKKLRASGGAHQVQRYDFTNAEGRQSKKKKKVHKVGKVEYVAPDAAYADRVEKAELTKEEKAAKEKAERDARHGAAKVKTSLSNMANYGSAEHEALKKKTAAAEVKWDGAGEKPGIQMWRVENKKNNFGVEHWPDDKHGTFYDGDSFIVLHTFKSFNGDSAAAADDAKDCESTEVAAAAESAAAADSAPAVAAAGAGSEDLAHDLYFWIGNKSTQDERGVAALKAVELDVYLDDKPVQYRMVQNHESEKFVKLFNGDGKGMIVLEGGIESGFNVVKPEEYEPRLLKVKGKIGATSVQQVKFSADSLNQGDVFVLDAGLQLYQWNGPEANAAEKSRASHIVQNIYANRQRGSGKVLTPITMDDNDNDEFWKLLGGSADDIQDADTLDAKVSESEPELYCVSDASGEMAYTRVAIGTLKKNMLGTGDVYIVDAGTEIYIWVGAKASKEENRCAMLFAMDYLSHDDSAHENSPITRLRERDSVLPLGFLRCFSDLKNV